MGVEENLSWAVHSLLGEQSDGETRDILTF